MFGKKPLTGGCKLSKKLKLLLLAVLLICLSSGVAFAENDDIVTVEVTARYQQDDARSMLATINGFRRGTILDSIVGENAQWNNNANGPVWALASNGRVDTASYKNLKDLEYDYVLEEIAMQRAMEIALRFNHDHMRPNDGEWDSYTVKGYGTSGENILYAMGTDYQARKAFEAWAETTDDYYGQGHRRNMLGKGFTCVGIAHVVIDAEFLINTADIQNYTSSTKLHFWVQEFGYNHAENGTTKTAAENGTVTRTVEVKKSNIKNIKVEVEPKTIEIAYGAKKKLNSIKTKLTLHETVPQSVWFMYDSDWEEVAIDYGVEINDSYTLASSNTAIAAVSGTTITGKKVGTTTVRVMSDIDNSKYGTVNVKVVPASIKKAKVTLSSSKYTYNGTAFKPKATVTLNGKTLIEGTDYTLAYSNNVNAGTATVTVTGKGNYKDKATTTFTISKASIQKATVTGIVNKKCTGKAATQNPTVKLGTTTLKNGTHYTLSYKNNVNAGKATVTITGKGNYTGTITKNFTIAHDYKAVAAKAATCGTTGNKAYYTCAGCKGIFSDTKGTKTTKAAMTINATGKHKWDAGKVTKQPTTAAAGEKTFTCTVCKATRKEPIAKLKEVALRRVYGDDRYTTALAIAETYMNETGQQKLNSIIVACATNFPDALAGSYLANAKKAPIIIWHDSRNAMIQTFIKQKVKSEGTVYILGGTSAVGDSIKKNMGAYKFVRLADSNRYGTDLKILNAVGIKNAELLVCDATEAGKGINALIASATGKPILLVAKGGLLDIQKTWLSQNKSKIAKITIIGNANSVDTKVESQLKAYGTVTRIGGKNGDEVSANVGKTYFKDAKEIFIATMDNYPDGLCGGPLAISAKGPIILVNGSVNATSANYAKTLNNLQRATVFGGDKAMPEATARKVAKNTSAKMTEYKKQ